MRLRWPARRQAPPAGDLVERIDGKLARLAEDLRFARDRGENAMAPRLVGTMNRRLEQRHGATSNQTAPYRP